MKRIGEFLKKGKVMTDLFKTCDTLKAELERLRPVEKKHLTKIRSFWQIGLAYSSNALEGNTLTESETKVILENGITIGGKTVREHMEALGHKDALTHLFSIYQYGYTEACIKELHRLFYYRINAQQAGLYRAENVIITGTDYVPPTHDQLPTLMGRFGENISANSHPIEQAAKAHEELVNIHPFIDGNGRTARLLMNLIFLKSGYPVVIIPPIYRSRYIEAAKAGNKGQSGPFISFLAGAAEQTLRDYLRMLESLR